MITAIVRFRLPPGTTRDDAKALFEKSVPNYQGVPGLVRKYYLYGDDLTGGGVYLWTERAIAERFYSEAWRTRSSCASVLCPKSSSSTHRSSSTIRAPDALYTKTRHPGLDPRVCPTGEASPRMGRRRAWSGTRVMRGDRARDMTSCVERAFFTRSHTSPAR